KAGANAVVRPTRVYPEILARALAHPGSEKVLEEILDAGGAECTRLEVGWDGAWKDLVGRLSNAEVGTAVGYESPEGEVRVNPRFAEIVRARAIFALVTGEIAGAQARAAAALRGCDTSGSGTFPCGRRRRAARVVHHAIFSAYFSGTGFRPRPRGQSPGRCRRPWSSMRAESR